MDRTIINSEIYNWITSNLTPNDIRHALNESVENLSNEYHDIISRRCKDLGGDIEMLRHDEIKRVVNVGSSLNTPVFQSFTTAFIMPVINANQKALEIFVNRYGEYGGSEFINPVGSIDLSKCDVTDFYAGIDIQSYGGEIRSFADLISYYYVLINPELICKSEEFFRVFGFYPRIAGDLAIQYFINLGTILKNTNKDVERFVEILNRDIKIGYWKKLFKDKKLSFKISPEKEIQLDGTTLYDYYDHVLKSKEMSRKFKLEFHIVSDGSNGGNLDEEILGDIMDRVNAINKLRNDRFMEWLSPDKDDTNTLGGENIGNESEAYSSSSNEASDEYKEQDKKHTDRRKTMNTENTMNNDTKTSNETKTTSNETQTGTSRTKKMLILLGCVGVGVGLYWLGKKIYDEYIDVCEVVQNDEFFEVK